MIRGPGDGWFTCSLGHRHWGRLGAAGLLLSRRSGEGTLEVLLQHRAPWTHQGDTWGVAGGARHPGESAVAAALREAREEVGIVPDRVQVTGIAVDDHGSWAYRTVLAEALVTDPTDLATAVAAGETAAVEWVPVPDVETMVLHPGFASTWGTLRAMLPGVTLVVDAANVVGSSPDGWWHDRTGATLRLLDRLDRLAAAGIAAARFSTATRIAGDTPGRGAPEHVHPRIDVVVEGVVGSDARLAGFLPSDDRVGLVRASGSGDDALVGRVRALRAPSGGTHSGDAPTVVVVTADRALRERTRLAGASVVGPRWLVEAVAGFGA